MRARAVPQFLRPLPAWLGIPISITISATTYLLVDGADMPAYVMDDFTIKKTLSFFWAFVIGFYTPIRWFKKLDNAWWAPRATRHSAEQPQRQRFCHSFATARRHAMPSATKGAR